MKELFGLASLAVVIAAYAPYLRDILKRKTKPHALSWLVWSVLAAIAFAIQITNDGGAGSWLMGVTSLITFVIFLLSFRYGEKNILTVDWLSLLFAAGALLLWFITDNPLWSVLLIALIDAVGGFFPTFRKSIKHPEQETVSSYFIYGFSLCLSLLALGSFNFVNAFYPASFVFINWGLCLFLIIRRRQLKIS